MESKEDLEKKIQILRAKQKEIDNAEAEAWFGKWVGKCFKIEYISSAVFYYVKSYTVSREGQIFFSGVKIYEVYIGEFEEKSINIFNNSTSEYYNIWLEDTTNTIKEITKEEFVNELPVWGEVFR